MSTPWLTDDEIADLCAPLTQPAAQARYLRGLGLTVKLKPNGRPLVLRSNVEATLGGLPAPTKGKHASPVRQPCQPDAAALRLAYSRN